ncbi:MAG: pyridoxamine 5'-phosphate oxidase family protein [Desulfobacterales bacterium]|jgi:nitroimidazol reductase NimA-like FMN-containing flavoprotein (pyridoxamine 5'-phosphate oxidase superfamily)
MRRKEREITDQKSIEDIINKAWVCRLAMVDGDCPYVVPLCFGYADRTLYFHSAAEGKKLEILKKNNRVCFEFDIDPSLKTNAKPCAWGMNYKSVIGFGHAYFLNDVESQRRALDIIMRNYSIKAFEYENSAIEKTTVIKVEIEQMTGKQSA